jgi:hypothetical protein
LDASGTVPHEGLYSVIGDRAFREVKVIEDEDVVRAFEGKLLQQLR